MKMEQAQRRYIEYELRHYAGYCQALRDRREEVLEGSPPPPDGLPRGNRPGNPTERKALQLIPSTAYIEMDRVVKSIDRALASLEERHREIFRIVYVEGKQERCRVCAELHLSYETYNRGKNELIYAAGLELGVLKSIG